MRAQEFDNLTEEELQNKANSCFIQAENTNVQIAGGDSERLRLLLEAQFYLTAVARKRDEDTAQRDFWLEIGVIALILAEIILSLYFGSKGITEGNQQAQVLAHLDKSTADTASAMAKAKDALETLTSQQASSLASLNEMNQSLQDSLKQTGIMASFTRKELQILEEEQANRLAQQSKKPKFQFYVRNVQLSQAAPIDASPRLENDTSSTFDLMLFNSGNATAHKSVLHVRLFTKELFKANDVSMTGEGGVKVQHIPLQPGWAENDFNIQLGDVRPGWTPLAITFNYPKGQPQFQVRFSLDADEADYQTSLGDMFVTPYRRLEN